MKQILLDTETTGVDIPQCGMVQVAGRVIIDGQVAESFDLCCKPINGDRVSMEALEVNGRSLDEINSFPDPRETYRLFTDLLGRHVDKYKRNDKFIMIGYNARFDADVLRAWFAKLGDQYYGSWFFFPPIDVMNLAATALTGRRASMLNFKLATVAATLGIVVPEGMHDAAVDIEITAQVMKASLEIITRQTQETLERIEQ
jgi:DNA polymerase-3 subunit epsilon